MAHIPLKPLVDESPDHIKKPDVSMVISLINITQGCDIKIKQLNKTIFELNSERDVACVELARLLGVDGLVHNHNDIVECGYTYVGKVTVDGDKG